MGKLMEVTNTTIAVTPDSFLDYACPEKHNYRLQDIEKSLKKLCRFTGHLDLFYSVYHHSLFTYYLATKIYADDKWTQFYALLHDAHEAYTGDINTPLANYLCKDKIESLKTSIQNCIYNQLEYEYPNEEQLAKVKVVDTLAYKIESSVFDNMRYDYYTEMGKHNLNPEETLNVLFKIQSNTVFWLTALNFQYLIKSILHT